MSPEERQLLQGLFDRIRGAAGTQRDREAEAFILDNVRQQPYAPYLLAQTVIVQDQALRAANERLQQLEAQIQDYQRQGEPQQQPGAGGFLSGIGALFGGGAPQAGSGGAPQGGFGGGSPQGGYGGGRVPQAGWGGAPPQPGPWGQPAQQNNAPPSYPPLQGGPWSGQPAPSGGGGGFLQGALGAAAGVAGGVLLADSIRGLFGGHNNGLGIAAGFGGGGLGQGGFGQGGLGGGETVVNNYYEGSPGASSDDYRRDDAGHQDISDGLDDFPDSGDYSSDV